MVDTDSPYGMWFERLARALHDRRTGRSGAAKWNRGLLDNKVERPPLDLLDAYFRGDPPLRSDIHSGWKPYVRAFLRAGRYNIAEKTVTSTSNRMDLRAFQTAATDDEMGDQFAHELMLANEFSILTGEVHDLMLDMGDGYTLTQPPTNGETFARTTAEDPRQVITAHDPLTGQILAGLKLYRDEWDAADFAYVGFRMDDGSVVMQRLRHEGRSIITNGVFRLNAEQWELDGDEMQSPGGVMPFERFRNRFGAGEFERHLDTLDRINDKIFNEWWIAKIQAFRQRAVRNLPDTEQVPQGDGTVKEVEIDYTDMFTASPDEMWQVPGDVDFWESQPVDLTPITASVQKDLERYAAAVNLPLHTITPDAANGSAEGATLMREEHVYTIGDRINRVDRRWCSVMAKMFAYSPDPEVRKRADVTKISSIWGPVERYSLDQKAQAASQLKGIYPIEAIWTDVLQKSPTEVQNLRKLRGRDALYGVIPDAPTPPAAPTPAPLDVVPPVEPPAVP